MLGVEGASANGTNAFTSIPKDGGFFVSTCCTDHIQGNFNLIFHFKGFFNLNASH